MLATNSLLARLPATADSFRAADCFNCEPMTSLCRLMRLRNTVTQPSAANAIASANASTRRVWVAFHQGGWWTTTTSPGDRSRI